MEIILSDAGKQFQKNWIFRHFTYHFQLNKIIGIRGENGSGKSTLLSVISSILPPNEGKVEYQLNGKEISFESARFQFGIASPSLELIPSATVDSILRFHFQFYKLYSVKSCEEFLNLCWLTHAKDLQVKELSSGMLQRLKLSLAFFSNNKFLLLDEPTSNLDQRGIDFVQFLIQNYQKDRGIIIASNEERDFQFCQDELSIQDYKG